MPPSLKQSTHHSIWTNHTFVDISDSMKFAAKILAVQLFVFAVAFGQIGTPTSLQSSSITPSSVYLDWGSVSGANHFETQVDDNSNFASLASNPTSTSSSVSVSGLSPGTLYYWRVRAFPSNGNGNPGQWSSTATFATLLPSPTNLVFSAVTASTVSLSWNSVSGATSYTIHLDNNSDFGSPTPNITQPGTSVTATSLSNGTRYYWRVKASNANAPSGWTQGTSFVTLVPAPTSKPTGLSHWDFGPYILGWNRVDGADSYFVELYTNSSFSPGSLVGGDTTSSYWGFTVIRNLSAGVTYYWRVRGVNSGGSGPWSTENDSFTLEPDPPVLVAPSNGATGISTSATLSWSASIGSTSYSLQYSTSSGFPSEPQTATTTVNGISGISQNVSGLSSSTKYYWHVKATNSGGTSNYSSTFSFTTSAAVSPPPAPVLSLPSDGATGVSTSPAISWGSSLGAISYRLQISTSQGFSPTVLDDSSLTGTSRQGGPLSNNTKYYWRVRAKNAGGTSAYSSVFSFTTIIAVPGAPDSLASAPTSSGATLTWRAVANATWYIGEVNDPNFILKWRDSVTSPSSTARNLSPATSYTWRVQAGNSAGGSVWTSSSFRTPVKVPDAPLTLTPTPTSTGASLGWSLVNGASAYVVEVYTNNNLTTRVWKDSLAVPPSSVTGLSNGTTYSWRVQAWNAGGPSGWTNSTFSTLSMDPPTSLAVGTVTATTASLRWSGPGQGTKFDIQLSPGGLSFTSVNSSPFTATPLVPNTAYTWQVRSTKSKDSSAWVSGPSFTTPAAPPPTYGVDAPTSLAVGTVTATTASLSWSGPGQGTKFDIQLSPGGLSFPSVNSSPFTATALLPSTAYTWQIRSTKSKDSSAWVSGPSFTTLAAPPPIYGLESPTNLQVASITSASASLSWDGPGQGAKFELKVSPGNISDGNSKSPYSLNSLSPKAAYSWQVRAVKYSDSSAWVSGPSFTTLDASAGTLVAPSNLQVTNVTSTSALLSWDGPGQGTKFDVKLSPGNLLFSNLNSSPLSVSTLSPSTTYTWQVRSTKTNDSSTWAAGPSFATNSAPVIPPTPTVAVVTSPSSATFTFSAPGGASLYNVQVLDKQNNGTVVGSGSTTDVSKPVIVSGLQSKTKYYYEATATVAGQTSTAAKGSFTTDDLTSAVGRFESTLPDEFRLSQNYPNPFNPTATIQFSLPSSSNVRITIYNALGNLVHVLVNGHYAPGRYTVTWDASSLPSGVYFYRLQTESFVGTKRLVLLK